MAKSERSDSRNTEKEIIYMSKSMRYCIWHHLEKPDRKRKKPHSTMESTKDKYMLGVEPEMGRDGHVAQSPNSRNLQSNWTVGKRGGYIWFSRIHKTVDAHHYWTAVYETRFVRWLWEVATRLFLVGKHLLDCVRPFFFKFSKYFFSTAIHNGEPMFFVFEVHITDKYIFLHFETVKSFVRFL